MKTLLKVKTITKARQDQENSEYTKQGKDFLSKNGITFRAEFIGRVSNPWKEKNYKVPNHSGDGNHARYKITFLRKDKELVIDSFTQSLMDSNLCKRYDHLSRPIDIISISPSAYCVLSGLTKYDPETFEDFCGEFDYDTDSIKAEEVFEAVDKEWHSVKKFFTNEELEELQEIQ